MASWMTLSALFMAFIPSDTATTTLPSENPALNVAIEEMQRANYFTFVLLINMSPSNRIKGNISFLMPNDRTLSKTIIPENAIVDFLLRHSIPSPLLIDHLERFPTGSMIPASKLGFMLSVLNNGRSHFSQNNNSTVPSASWSSSARPPETAAAAPPASPLPPSEHPSSGLNLPSFAASPPTYPNNNPQKSHSSNQIHNWVLFEFVFTCLMLNCFYWKTIYW